MKYSGHTFFKQGLAGALLLDASAIARAVLPNPIKPKAPKTVNPFHLGMAGYTLVSFDLDTTLKTLERLNIHYLCIKGFYLPLDSTDEQIRALHNKYAAHKVTGYVASPAYMKSEEKIDRTFDYAKQIGVKLIIGASNYEPLPYVDKKMRKYDFHHVIHSHSPDIETYPDTTSVWEHTGDLDPRIGMCLDVRYDLRNGCDPVVDLKRYHTRVSDMHVKDVAGSSKAGVGIEVSRGEIDFPVLICMTREVSHTGVCSLEYEKDMKDPLLRIAESIGYFKTVSDLTQCGGVNRLPLNR